MHAEEVEIVNPSGLHTRPGHAFVKKAKEFKSTVTVVKGDMRGNGKSLLGLMKVGVMMGDRILIVAEGPDEIEAARGLAALVVTLED